MTRVKKVLSLTICFIIAAIMLLTCISSLDNCEVYAKVLESGAIRYNVKESKLFDKNNVSPAINDTVKKMKKGDKLFLQDGNYRFKETIQIVDNHAKIDEESPFENCMFELNGTYTMDGNFTAMIIDGSFISVKVGTVTTGNKSDDYLTAGKLPCGIVIKGSDYSEFKFDKISGFDQGLKLAPEDLLTGMCYDKISFNNIEYCNSGIMLFAGIKKNGISSSWVNENVFYGGTISKCYRGLFAKKGPNQVDQYNNNTYNNLKFVDIGNDAIYSEFSSFNSFYNPEFVNVTRYYIDQKDSSSHNKFYLNSNIPNSKIKLFSRGDTINGNITDDSGKVFASQIQMTNDKSKSKYAQTYTFSNMQTIEVKNKSVVLPLNILKANVTATTSPVVLSVDSAAEFENSSFILNVIDATKGISVKTSTGATLFSGKLNSNGEYKITYINGEFKAIKLI